LLLTKLIIAEKNRSFREENHGSNIEGRGTWKTGNEKGTKQKTESSLNGKYLAVNVIN